MSIRPAVSILLFAAAMPAASTPVSQWLEQVVTGPSGRGEFGFAYDSAGQEAVLFGGAASLNFSAVNGQTWTWNGVVWSLADSSGLTQRCDNAMAYDSVRDRVVSFGGFNGTYLGDTWIRSAGAWLQIAPSPAPTPRADSFMAFDSQRGVMVLFGGQAPTQQIRRDTWEFADSTWVQRAIGGPPPNRWIHRMAYDSARGVTVMFGGAAASSLLADTWEWDGTAWTENTAAGPPKRYGHAMAYDTDHARTVLFGGQSAFPFGQGVLGDTWTYDGTSWTELPIPGPSARSFVKMVYDSNRKRLVLFGGWDGTQMVDDTWELVLDAETGVRSDVAGPRWLRVTTAPNPFRPRTEIRYELPVGGSVELTIHNAAGALVRRLLEGTQAAGPHAVAWDGRDDAGAAAAGGTYFYRLRAGTRETSGSVVLLR